MNTMAASPLKCSLMHNFRRFSANTALEQVRIEDVKLSKIGLGLLCGGENMSQERGR